jgi:hypothetical protein
MHLKSIGNLQTRKLVQELAKKKNKKKPSMALSFLVFSIAFS